MTLLHRLRRWAQMSKRARHDTLGAELRQRRSPHEYLEIGAVMLQIDAPRGAMIRTAAVNGGRIAPRSPIAGEHFRVEVGQAGSAPADQARLIEIVRVARDRLSGKGSGCARKYQYQYALASVRFVAMNIAWVGTMSMTARVITQPG